MEKTLKTEILNSEILTQDSLTEIDEMIIEYNCQTAMKSEAKSAEYWTNKLLTRYNTDLTQRYRPPTKKHTDRHPSAYYSKLYSYYILSVEETVKDKMPVDIKGIPNSEMDYIRISCKIDEWAAEKLIGKKGIINPMGVIAELDSHISGRYKTLITLQALLYDARTIGLRTILYRRVQDIELR